MTADPRPAGLAADQACPKHMVMGPCGGVRPDGGCEVHRYPCVFPAPVPWRDPVAPVPLDAVPLILTDFSSEPYSASAHATVAAILAPVSDAVLVGEHQDRPDFPPAQLASMLQQAGARPWITLSCRDRNRVVLEQELRGLRQLGVDAVLCVTGDARAHDVPPGATQAFDLDAPRPGAAAARAGVTIPVIAAVAICTDPASVSALSRLPGLELEPALVRAVLDDPDPVAAGIAAAAGQARDLLAIPGVAGVNISGLASARGPEFAAQIKAELA